MEDSRQAPFFLDFVKQRLTLWQPVVSQFTASVIMVSV
jgi:hypothetical protein